MLARTAENLFWLARYLERTDYVTRLLQVANRVGETQVGDGFDSGTEWHSTIVAAGCEEGFYNKYESANEKNVTRFLISDIDNSSSILSCLETARRNARSVRTALTSDMWDAVNVSGLGKGAGRAVPWCLFKLDVTHGFILLHPAWQCA
jgi:uncharacterized alpha-E superfamily protein